MHSFWKLCLGADYAHCAPAFSTILCAVLVPACRSVLSNEYKFHALSLSIDRNFLFAYSLYHNTSLCVNTFEYCTMSPAVSSHYTSYSADLKIYIFYLCATLAISGQYAKDSRFAHSVFCSTLHFKTSPVAYKRRPHLTHPTLWCRYRHVPGIKGVNVSSHHDLICLLIYH